MTETLVVVAGVLIGQSLVCWLWSRFRRSIYSQQELTVDGYVRGSKLG